MLTQYRKMLTQLNCIQNLKKTVENSSGRILNRSAVWTRRRRQSKRRKSRKWKRYQRNFTVAYASTSVFLLPREWTMNTSTKMLSTTHAKALIDAITVIQINVSNKIKLSDFEWTILSGIFTNNFHNLTIIYKNLSELLVTKPSIKSE